jgi:hypothetical protein
MRAGTELIWPTGHKGSDGSTMNHGRALLVERGARVPSLQMVGGGLIPDENRPTSRIRSTPGEWNSYRIHASGSHIESGSTRCASSVLDDHQRDAAVLSGFLALQLQRGSGPAKVQFRNLRLTQLGRTEPPPVRPVPSDAASVNALAAPAIGEMRRNGDPPLRRTANVANSNRADTSPVLWHLQPNPAKATAVANPAAQELGRGNATDARLSSRVDRG